MNEELANLIRTFEALGPVVSNAVKSGQLFEPQCALTEPDSDILCEYDVRIPMSEGFSIAANIFRSKTAPLSILHTPSRSCRTFHVGFGHYGDKLRRSSCRYAAPGSDCS